jgi:hypothetical protein
MPRRLRRVSCATRRPRLYAEGGWVDWHLQAWAGTRTVHASVAPGSRARSIASRAVRARGTRVLALLSLATITACGSSVQVPPVGALQPAVYANAGHTFMYVGGARFDTSGRSGVYGSRWQAAPRSLAGFTIRHWPGL